MKIDQDFAVKVESRVFTGNEIDKIVIDGGKFSMVCTYTNGSKFEVSARAKDVELLNTAQIPPLTQGEVITGRDMTHVYYGYSKVGDEPKSDVEVVYPIKTIEQAFKESTDAIKKAGEAIQKCCETIKVDCSIDGERLSKLIKDYEKPMARSGGD